MPKETIQTILTFVGIGLVVLFFIVRGIGITQQAQKSSCPGNRVETINYLAVPFVQDTISCSPR